MTRIGIISFAHIHADRYANILATLPDCELTAIWDAVPGRGSEAARRYGSRFYENFDDFLAGGIDGVVVCSENSAHCSQVVAAASRGIHVLCEKPIATTIADGETMIAACAEAGTILTIAFPARFHHAVRNLRRIIRAGKLGRVLAIRGMNRGKMPGGWFLDQKLAGGGAVMDHTVHIVDLMRWYTGREISQVYAEAGIAMLHDVQIDDIGLLFMQIGEDLFATLDTSWSRPSSYPTWGDAKMEIIGTNGVAYLDRTAETLSIYEEGELTTRYESWGQNANRRMIQEFVMAIRGEIKPIIDGFDGLQTLKVALAAYRSAEMHEPVEVDADV